MAGELRQWADIDLAWLQSYLQQHRLAGEFDLDDELLGSQVSWILNTEEWTRLRDAWNMHQRTGEVADADTHSQAAEQSLPTQEAPIESAGAEPDQIETNIAHSGHLEEREIVAPAQQAPAAAVPDTQAQEERRLFELTQTALSDWGAFKELFHNCPEGADLDSLEGLADSPVALMERAKELIVEENAKADAHREEQEHALEEKVNRAQNIVAGYYLYCQKSRLTPTLEHMLVHIPMMRNGYSPEVVKEAWKRQSEHAK